MICSDYRTLLAFWLQQKLFGLLIGLNNSSNCSESVLLPGAIGSKSDFIGLYRTLSDFIGLDISVIGDILTLYFLLRYTTWPVHFGVLALFPWITLQTNNCSVYILDSSVNAAGSRCPEPGWGYGGQTIVRFFFWAQKKPGRSLV